MRNESVDGLFHLETGRRTLRGHDRDRLGRITEYVVSGNPVCDGLRRTGRPEPSGELRSCVGRGGAGAGSATLKRQDESIFREDPMIHRHWIPERHRG